MSVTTVGTKLRFTVGVLLATGLVGCPSSSEWSLINAADTDCFPISVSPAGDDDDSAGDDDDSAGDDDTTVIELHSAPGLFALDVIGTAELTPPSGPAGTRFVLTVELVDTGSNQGNPTTAVGRATVTVDNGDLDLNELEMEPSPVDERFWTITVVAGGDPETTTRQDDICVSLYTTSE
ncbi:MAG: hypothetical protein KDA24_02805 [Deltaproteobacteria bacterium]|nr:hypothetical protein [Deltaproteobacteria bacterium]